MRKEEGKCLWFHLLGQVHLDETECVDPWRAVYES
jgi:hypothetical protein